MGEGGDMRACVGNRRRRCQHLRLLSTFSVLGPVCADNEPLGYPLGALGSFPAKYCSRARLNG